MALKFDPKLDPKNGSKRAKRRNQDSKRASSLQAERSSRGSRVQKEQAAVSAKGKRKSIADKTNKKAQKQQAKEAKLQEKEDKKLAKLQAKNEQLAAKQKADYSQSQAASLRHANYEQENEEVKVERLGDVRKRERQAQNRKKYWGYVLKLALLVVLVLGLIFGAIFVYRSNLFAIQNVQVEGVSHLTSQEITQLAAVSDGSTLLRCDTNGIISRLKEHAWIQDASVKRKFPHTLELVITERQPAAVVKLNSKSIWVVSSDGTWLSAATSNDWDTNRKIIDVNTAISSPSSGVNCNDDGIKNAIAIYEALPEEFAAQVKTISAESAIKAQLNLKNGVVVAFGEANDIDLKVSAIQSLLNDYKGKIAYINVRVPSRPTYRKL